MHIFIAILIGVLVAWAFQKRQQQDFCLWQLAAVMIAAVFPYIDNLFFLLGGGFGVVYQYTFTWSLLLAPAYAWLLSQGFCYFLKGHEPESPYKWQRFFVPSLAALCATIFMGVLSENDIALLAPLWFGRASLGVVHSFDVGLLVGLVVLTLLGLMLPKWKTDIARGVFVLLLVYVGIVGTFKLKAHNVGDRYANVMGLKVEKIYTVPQVLSPFYWRIIVLTTDQRLHDTLISLKRSRPLAITDNMTLVRRAKAVYMPIHEAIWRIYNRFGRTNPDFAEKAWASDVSQSLYWLNKFTVFQSVEGYDGRPCAQFQDLRFGSVQSERTSQYWFCQTEEDGFEAYQAAEDGSFFRLETMY